MFDEDQFDINENVEEKELMEEIGI